MRTCPFNSTNYLESDISLNGIYVKCTYTNNWPCLGGMVHVYIKEPRRTTLLGPLHRLASTIGILLPTTSMTHCGTDLAASLATAVTTLPNHGFTEN